MAFVLLMEDDPASAYRIAGLLEGLGHDTTLARSASDAIARLYEDRFDLLITDIFVVRETEARPEGGIRLIGHMRQQRAEDDGQHLRRTPILAITGAPGHMHRRDILALAETLGADATMGKPICEGSFQRVVETLLSRAQP